MATPDKFRSKYGPWALVTGAARGLGTEFSRQIGGLGLNLVLVDIIADEMAGVAEEIRRHTGREVKTVVTDLGQPGFMKTIREQTEGIEIGLLVSNAAFPPVGLFFEQSLEDKLRMVDVNVRAPLMLVEEFGRRMLVRNRGGVILVSSASALQGVPHIASYAVTKAYNLILAESLWGELRGHGVDVLGFMPGTTRTTGFVLSKPRLERSRLATVMEPAATAAEALEALSRTPSHIAGARNRWTIFLAQRLLPRRRLIMLVGNTMRAWYGKD
jgi:short-subunit dehydrogenase